MFSNKQIYYLYEKNIYVRAIKTLMILEYHKSIMKVSVEIFLNLGSLPIGLQKKHSIPRGHDPLDKVCQRKPNSPL